MLVIPALGRLRQKDHEFKESLSYIARPVSKNKQKNPKQTIATTTKETQPNQPTKTSQYFQ
jgi:hypothetical protein